MALATRSRKSQVGVPRGRRIVLGLFVLVNGVSTAVRFPSGRRSYGHAAPGGTFGALTVLVTLMFLVSAQAQTLDYAFDLSGNLTARTVGSMTAPQILGQPQLQIVQPGDLASFSVVLADTSAVSYQWRFNGTNIGGQTNDALLLLNVSTNNQGPYTVVVTNSAGSVTSTVAQLYIDSDRDGLPDSWELTYFGNLTSQRSEGDADGDGVSNRQEFLDGTNPTNSASRNLRLTIFSDGGSVAAAPTKLSYTNGENVTLTATPFPPNSFHGWTGDLVARTNPAGLMMNTNKTVRARFICQPAPAGLVAWWRGEADAGDLIGGHNGAFYSGTNAVGPTVTNNGFVDGAFAFDGTNYVRVPDSADLKPAQLTLETWVFPTSQTGYKTVIARGSASNDDDGYWLGTFNGTPQFQSKHGGSMQALSGSPLLLNQWTHLAATFDGSTKRLYVNGLLAASAGGLGAINYDPAALPVTLGADWVANAPAYVFSGEVDEVSLYDRALTAVEVLGIYLADVAGKCTNTPCFTSSAQLADGTTGTGYTQQMATVLGTLPVSFSLSAGSLPAGLALSSSGTVSGVPATAGSNIFAVLATDAAGQSTEQICGLRVLQAPSPAMVPGLVGWWRAENDALDSAGTNNGTLVNGAGFANGKVGQALSLNGINQYLNVNVAGGGSLDMVGTITVEVWVRRLVTGVQHSIMERYGPASGGYALRVTSSDKLSFSTVNNSQAADTVVGGTSLLAGAWYHVAGLWDGSSLKVYVNGVLDGTANSVRNPKSGSTPVRIGARGDDANTVFAGLIDEVSLYGRALSAAEVASLYHAGAAGKISVGPYINTAAALPDAFVNQAYTQTISTIRGTAPISHAVVAGALPAGTTIGSGGVLSGTPTNAGSFSFTVRATDAASLTADQLFTLQVFSKVPPPGGLVGWWRAETNALDSAGTNNGVLKNGAAFAAGEAGQAFALDGSSQSIEIADAPGLRPASLTAEAWVLFNSASGTQQILGKPLGSGFLDSFALALDNGSLVAVVADATGVGPVLSFSFAPVLGQWYHVAFTFDDSSKQQVLYLNGAPVASGVANKSVGYDTHAMLLGRDDTSGSPTFFVSGRIDETALYTRALGATEIASIYGAGPAGKTVLGPYFNTPPVLPEAIVSQAYTQTIVSVRGTAPISFAVASGVLPAGLSLSSAGVLSGDPSTTGSFSFVLRATDAASLTAEQTFTIEVLPKLSPPAGMVGWWRAENNALDSAGANAGALINGATFAAGEVGVAFSLSNGTGFINIPDSPSLRPASLTIEAWVAFFSAGGPQIIFAKPLGGGTADSYALWLENGGLNASVADSTGAGTTITKPFTPVLGQWYHLAFSFDAATKEQWLYLDGAPVQTGLANRDIGYDPHPVLLGADVNSGSTNGFLLGRIDEAAIYNRALSAAEIGSIYSAGAGGKTSAGPYFTTPPLLPYAVSGQPYTQMLASARGTLPVTYVLGTGVLPSGITLSGAGVLSGIPTTGGTFSFVVRATDATGLFAESSFALDVFQPVPMPQGLIGWWRAENDALDTAGTNNGLLINGAGFAPGQAGQAFSLDGSSQSVQIADAPALRPASLTIEGWVLFNAVNGTRVLWAKPLGSGSLDSYVVALDSAGLEAAVADATAFGPILTFPFSPLLGHWYYVAYTYDNASRQQVLYLDGLTVASGAGDRSIGYDTHPVLLGRDLENGSSTYFFSGRLDETSIYNRALNATEIASIFNAGPAGKLIVGSSMNILLTSTNTILILWPSSSTGFALQQNTNPSPLNWVPVTNTVNDNGVTKSILVNPPAGNMFYRLRHP